MEVHLKPEQEAFIDRNLRNGRFASRDEALQHAVRLLEEQERFLDELKIAVDEADDDIAQGHYSEYTDQTLPRLVEELKSEGRARKAAEADKRITDVVHGRRNLINLRRH